MFNRWKYGKISMLAAGCAAILISTAAQADTTLYLAAYGGSYAKTYKQEIIPPFEKKHNVNVVYIAGNSTDTLAKLKAQRGNQQIDVAIMDDGPMYQAINYGLMQPLEDGVDTSVVYSFAQFPEDKAAGLSLVAGALAYNKKLFKEKGWSAPDSWAALADPRFAGHILIPSITNSYGIYALIMTAKMHGGSASDIEPGFKFFKNEIAPKVLSFTPSPGRTSQLFQAGRVWLACWGSSRIEALADTGFPVGIAYPKEGAVALVTAAAVPKGAPHSKLAKAFINYLLTPEVQKTLAIQKGYGPANKNVQLPDSIPNTVPYGERAKSLVRIDWGTINKNRLKWTHRWNREIER